MLLADGLAREDAGREEAVVGIARNPSSGA
jgi:hypothetical protein